MKKSIRCRTIKIISLILAIFITCFVLSYLFLPKRDKIDDNYTGKTLSEFYYEDSDTIDVIYLGASNVFCGISPLEIWNEYKITGYDIAVGSATPWTDYYLLKEVLEYQTPQLVIVDLDTSFSADEPSEEYTRKAFDYFKFLSPNLINAVTSDAYDNSYFDYISYIFPIFRYHDRYNEISANDILFYKNLGYNTTKGYVPYKNIKPNKVKFSYLKTNDKGDMTEKSKKYLKMIIELCKSHGVKIAFSELPSNENWSLERDEYAYDFCEENNIDFIDLNSVNVMNEINLDWNKDTSDGGIHLNYDGMKKATDYIGKYVVNNIKKRNYSENVENEWNNCYKKYRELVDSIS